MYKILVVESSARDAERFRALLQKEGLEVELCGSGAEAERVITANQHECAAAIIVWETAGPPFGFDLLARCRQIRPEMPVVVVSGMLDAALATRAFALGARDFLEKPLDAERVKHCLNSLLAEQDPWSPLVIELRRTIIGESTALLSMLKQIAKVIPRSDSRVLLIGESGTGKELLAQAIHQLGAPAGKPCIAVNIGEIPATLIESALFGHEKGAFTGAGERHIGFLEEAGGGTLFLDEIGDLDLSLQGKLLRVIQEKAFRRLKSTQQLPFAARLVCATNRDLAQAVNQGTFRRDLFHRIAEVTIQVPPLRHRKGDVDLLLKYFLDLYRAERQTRFARETLTILRSYTYPGNIRELQNLVKAALIDCDGEVILPQHLPLQSMGAFLNPESATVTAEAKVAHPSPDNHAAPAAQKLLDELSHLLPDNWLELPYREAAQPYERAFDRIYLQCLLERWRHNVSRAAAAAGIDAKTFRKKWKECGLPPLRASEEESDA
jgi:DNA-binding NtrC family response regulator